MKNRKFISLFIAFTLLIISLIWIRLVQQHRTDEKATIAATIQRNSNLAVALEQYTIRTIRNVDAVLQIIKTEYEKEGATIDISKKIAEYSMEFDFFNEVAIIDESGKLIASNQNIEKHAHFNYSNRPSFLYHSQATSGELHISKPIMSLTLHKTMLILSRRLTKADGRFGGIVAMQIEPTTFTRFYADAELRQHDIISLIAPDGITYVRRTGDIESHSENISKSPLFGHVRKMPIGDYMAKDAIRGIPTYFSYRKLLNYPIIATVGTSVTDALAPFEKSSRRDYLFATLISFLIILFTTASCIALLHRKRIIKKVKESEVKYRSIVENSREVILLLQPDGSIHACNPSGCKAFMIEESMLLLQSFKELLSGTAAEVAVIMQNVLSSPIFESELQFKRADNTVFTGETVSTLNTDNHGKKSITVIIRDVTERKRMATKMEKEQKRFQQKLTRHVISAQEQEREDIGRELHDNVNQVLTTVKLYLEMAKSNHEQGPVLISKSIELVKGSINEIRCLSHSLSAPTLGTNSLLDALNSLLDSVRATSLLTIHFSSEGFKEGLPKEQKLAFYRIVQEQLNNIIKHAQASSVQINLSQTHQHTVLTIKDNGIGFDAAAVRTGIGINNIISRARAFEGNVQIQSQPGAGCSLTVLLPISTVVQVD